MHTLANQAKDVLSVKGHKDKLRPLAEKG